MKTRIISGLVMVPLLLVLYFGGIALWAAALVISLMGINEFCNGWNNLEVKPSKTICYVMTAALFLTYFAATGVFDGEADAVMALIPLWLFAAVAAGMIYGWKINQRGAYDAAATAVSLVYIPFFTYHMVLIDMTTFSRMIWIVVIAAFNFGNSGLSCIYFCSQFSLADTYQCPEISDFCAYLSKNHFLVCAHFHPSI